MRAGWCIADLDGPCCPLGFFFRFRDSPTAPYGCRGDEGMGRDSDDTGWAETATFAELLDIGAPRPVSRVASTPAS